MRLYYGWHGHRRVNYSLLLCAPFSFRRLARWLRRCLAPDVLAHLAVIQKLAYLNPAILARSLGLYFRYSAARRFCFALCQKQLLAVNAMPPLTKANPAIRFSFKPCSVILPPTLARAAQVRVLSTPIREYFPALYARVIWPWPVSSNASAISRTVFIPLPLANQPALLASNFFERRHYYSPRAVRTEWHALHNDIKLPSTSRNCGASLIFRTWCTSTAGVILGKQSSQQGSWYSLSRLTLRHAASYPRSAGVPRSCLHRPAWACWQW